MPGGKSGGLAGSENPAEGERIPRVCEGPVCYSGNGSRNCWSPETIPEARRGNPVSACSYWQMGVSTDGGCGARYRRGGERAMESACSLEDC